MNVVVDTNVPLVANRAAHQASPSCIATCARRLQEIEDNGVLVLDDEWYILREYMHRLRSEGQPGPGDRFLRWVLTHRANPLRCEMVHLTPSGDSFLEFPDDEALAGFDPGDHKFAAVAHAHPAHPPVLNATDSDWWHYRRALQAHGIQVDFVCDDYAFEDR